MKGMTFVGGGPYTLSSIAVDINGGLSTPNNIPIICTYNPTTHFSTFTNATTNLTFTLLG